MASMMKRLKELEEENRRLKKMYAKERPGQANTDTFYSNVNMLKTLGLQSHPQFLQSPGHLAALR